MPGPGRAPVRRIVGVYNADGSVLGELRYLVGRSLGNRHCALCDITHGRVRKKAEFTALQATFGLPIDVLHLEERPPDLASFTDGRAPCVVAETVDGYRMLLDAGELGECRGDVARFVDALRAALVDAQSN
jgi:hypothetical protein